MLGFSQCSMHCDEGAIGEPKGFWHPCHKTPADIRTCFPSQLVHVRNCLLSHHQYHHRRCSAYVLCCRPGCARQTKYLTLCSSGEAVLASAWYFRPDPTTRDDPCARLLRRGARSTAYPSCTPAQDQNTCSASLDTMSLLVSLVGLGLDEKGPCSRSQFSCPDAGLAKQIR